MHAPKPERGGGDAGRRVLGCIALLWLAGNGLRMTILAVPPLIPAIHDEFHMSETEVGILAGLPVVLFACAAVPGSMLIARFGALATVIIGLVATGLGSALRGAAPDVWAALCRDHRHRLRRRRHAALAAAAGAGLAARSHRLRHRGLYQWPADRGNSPGRADAAGRASPGRRKLAARLRSSGAFPASRSRRRSGSSPRGRPRPMPIRWCRGGGGRIGGAGCCGGSA